MGDNGTNSDMRATRLQRCGQELYPPENRRKLGILRKGHMGDVLLTEPVVRVLRQEFDHVTLYTDFPAVGRLIEAYDEILPYDKRLEISEGQFERVTELSYEGFPGINHLDGYARCADITLESRIPRIRCGVKRVIRGNYGLIAAFTSDWRRSMREWPKNRFVELADRLAKTMGFPFHLLEPGRSFRRMLSLVEHCDLFVGNDSGPAFLAQCFGRPTFVIFGATRPDLILVSETARRPGTVDRCSNYNTMPSFFTAAYRHHVYPPDVPGGLFRSMWCL